MAIYLPAGLPAIDVLRSERRTAYATDGQAQLAPDCLRILLLNLMPDKQRTEVQFARRLSESDFPVELVLLRPDSYRSKSSPKNHLDTFYRTWKEAASQPADGLIVTGAPVEHLSFDQVRYWQELKQIFSESRQKKMECLFVCWAAQAALHHFHTIPKRELAKKAFGVFEQQLLKFGSPSLEGMGAQFPCPVSRHSEVKWADVARISQIQVVAGCTEAGICLADDRDAGALYMFNHLEYDADTLAQEYQRETQISPNPGLPANYFPLDNPLCEPTCTWDDAASAFFRNWLRMTARKRMAQRFLHNAA